MGRVRGVSLHALADAAGLAVKWRDVHDQWHTVGDDTLRAVLGALGLPAMTAGEVNDSLETLRHPGRIPPLVTADAGSTLHLPVEAGPYSIALESGGLIEGQVADWTAFKVPDELGYHTLSIGGVQTILAVAPRRCWTVQDAMPAGGAWGLAVQLYSLRRHGDGGIGDFGGLADFVRGAARHGAAAVAISPVHAQFAATTDRFGPYAPSSRTLLNTLHAAVDLSGAEAERLEAEGLIDWPAATRLRLDAMDRLYEAEASSEAFQRYRAEGGASLEGHARFEALHAHQVANGQPWNWRQWAAGLADHDSPQVEAFAQAHADDVKRHAFRQYLAERSLADAQQAAKSAGMAIGLIADLAVGVDSGGSQCWAHPNETLLGLSIGAPPDLLNTQGQGWGIVAFSPRGLRLSGYTGFIDMLRAAMRHAGGVRIDHAMGLARLWVIPDGASSRDGVYLHFPTDDMMRLIRLESVRHKAVVLGEDLGTLPDGFQNRVAEAGIMGMRVLWFERALDLGFTAPSGWDVNAVSMTSTHDLATVAGWWRNQDTAWRRQLGLIDDGGVAREHWERDRDRSMLWSAMRASGSAHGEPPPAHEPERAVDAAIHHIGTAACELAILPIEDALGLAEQPNFPGTLDEHPNWRRRMPGFAADLLDDPAVAQRLQTLHAARTRS